MPVQRRWGRLNFPFHKPSNVDYVRLQTEDTQTPLPSTYSGSRDFFIVTLSDINLSELLYLSCAPQSPLVLSCIQHLTGGAQSSPST